MVRSSSIGLPFWWTSGVDVCDPWEQLVDYWQAGCERRWSCCKTRGPCSEPNTVCSGSWWGGQHGRYYSYCFTNKVWTWQKHAKAVYTFLLAFVSPPEGLKLSYFKIGLGLPISDCDRLSINWSIVLLIIFDQTSFDAHQILLYWIGQLSILSQICRFWD